jgi:hypothetical protein
MRPLWRYEVASEPEDEPKAYTCYKCPFRDIPPITSHIQPHFVIYNAGYKLSKFIDGRDTQDLFLDQYPSLPKTTALYLAWTQTLPERAKRHKLFNEPEPVTVLSSDEVDGHGSDVDNSEDGNYVAPTERGRVRVSRRIYTRSAAAAEQASRDRRRRTRSVTKDEQGTSNAPAKKAAKKAAKKVPAIRGKKRKVLSDSTFDPQLLYEANLSRLDQQFGGAVTRDIEVWRKLVSL